MRLSTLQGSWRLLSVLAVPLLVLSSCSSANEELATGADGPEQLAFSVSTAEYGDASRGTPLNSVSGTAGLIGFEFTGSWDSDDNKTYLMYNDVLQGSGETWKTSKSYLPDQTKKMRFYAYYPYQRDIDTEGGTLYFNSGTSTQNVLVPTFVYTTPATAAEQKDLMYAISDDVQYEDVGGTPTLQPIDLQFKHLLSALKITVNNGFDKGTIKRVSISKVCRTGRFFYEGELWEVPDDELTEVYQNVQVKTSTENTDVLPLTSSTQYFMLLPQTLNQSSILTIIYNDGNMDHEITYELGKKRITVGTDELPITFKQGKITTLNITITSVIKMTVKCSVTDWESGATFGEGTDQTVVVTEYLLHDWEDYPGVDTNSSTELDITTGPQ